jgi:dihydrolipoamide dehydrogenase
MEQEALYDVVVIGSGPGGYVAAIRAGQLGLKTLVVEKDNVLGGTCLHVGCIPTKALLYTAELLDTLKHASEFGLAVEGVRLDWAALQKRKERVVRRGAAGVGFLFKKNQVETIHGFGKLAGPGKVEVKSDDGLATIRARHVIVATGSVPRSLPGIEVDGHLVLTSDEILSLPSRPESLAIIGAGAVGVEFASMFASFGTKVTLIEMLPRLLPIEDEEISEALGKSFKKRGIESLPGTRVESVKKEGDSVTVTYATADGGTGTTTVEKLLIAVGRKPRTEGIGLETVGIETEKEFVPVSGFMETSAPDVFAIGDIVPSQQLAHVGSAEGILAVERIAGLDVTPMNYEHMPSCTYSSPEVASVGISEATAKERGYDVKVGRFPFSANSKAGILEQREGFVKIVSEAKYDELLGVHIIGPHATDLIAEAVVALEHEATAQSLMRAVHAHPTLSESVMEAAHAAEDKPIHV